MTNPRIEAAARALWSDGVWDSYSDHQKNARRRVMKGVLAAADEASWRPIDTAPLDGVYVDLWVIDDDGKGRRFTNAYYGEIPHTCGEYGEYCDSCPEQGDFWIDGIFGHEIYGEITHWMPLPKPPKEGA